MRLGRKRWAIEGFFKTIKHRFGLHRFGRSTKLGVYRWLLLSLISGLLVHWLVHWIDQWFLPPLLDWQAASDLALEVLFPTIVWFQLLKAIQSRTKIAAQRGFDIALQSLPNWA